MKRKVSDHKMIILIRKGLRKEPATGQVGNEHHRHSITQSGAMSQFQKIP